MRRIVTPSWARRCRHADLDDLRTLVAVNYPVGSADDCQLLGRGTNTTYLVSSAQARYVLRLYGRHWRSRADILYEVDLLLHLAHAGVPVSIPLARMDGSFVSPVQTVAGEQLAVLFTYA